MVFYLGIVRCPAQCTLVDLTSKFPELSIPMMSTRIFSEWSVAQSIYIYYSSLTGRPDIFLGSETSKIWVAKSRVQKKQGHCYSKREQARLPFLILSNNDPGFFALWFSQPYFEPFFSWSQTDPCCDNKNSGCRFTGQMSLAKQV